MDISRRLGVIEITKEFVYDFNLMKLVFSNFIPLSISCDFLSEKLTYTGYCASFTPVKEGDTIPKYEVEVEYNKDLIDIGFPDTSIRFHPLSEKGDRLIIHMGDGKNPKIDFILDRINR